MMYKISQDKAFDIVQYAMETVIAELRNTW
jgi:hypothetical protein